MSFVCGQLPSAFHFPPQRCFQIPTGVPLGSTQATAAFSHPRRDTFCNSRSLKTVENKTDTADGRMTCPGRQRLDQGRRAAEGAPYSPLRRLRVDPGLTDFSVEGQRVDALGLCVTRGLCHSRLIIF